MTGDLSQNGVIEWGNRELEGKEEGALLKLGSMLGCTLTVGIIEGINRVVGSKLG